MKLKYIFLIVAAVAVYMARRINIGWPWIIVGVVLAAIMNQGDRVFTVGYPGFERAGSLNDFVLSGNNDIIRDPFAGQNIY